VPLDGGPADRFQRFARFGDVFTSHCGLRGPYSAAGAPEAPKWRTYRAEIRAATAFCHGKRISVRDGSHLGVPQGFGPEAPLRRRSASKY
jgi:hypothetical protein